MIERRTDRRDDLVQVVRYAPSPYTSDTVLRGLIKDWSGSGICLIARQALEQGQEIIVNSVVVPKSKKAVVRWYKNLGPPSTREKEGMCHKEQQIFSREKTKGSGLDCPCYTSKFETNCPIKQKSHFKGFCLVGQPLCAGNLNFSFACQDD